MNEPFKNTITARPPIDNRDHREGQARGHHRGLRTPIVDVTEMERVKFVMKGGMVVRNT